MFCQKCGNQITEEASFCPGCGTSRSPAQANPQQQVPFQPQYQQNAGTPASILQTLSQKIRTQGVIWRVVACLQVLIGTVNLLIGLMLMDFDFFYFSDGAVNFFTGLFVLLIAVLNFSVSGKNFKYSKEVLQKPVGIVKKYEPIGIIIGNLIYNLFFG